MAGGLPAPSTIRRLPPCAKRKRRLTRGHVHLLGKPLTRQVEPAVTQSTPEPAATNQQATQTNEDGQQSKQLDSTAARSANGQPTFSQADIDRIIATRLSEEKAKHDRELQEAQDRAGKSELDAARLDIEKFQALAAEAETKARATILDERITALVADGDVKKDRRARLAAMISREGLADLDAAEQRAKITAQIGELLTEMPEWKASSVPGSAGGPTKSPSGATVTLEAFKTMTTTERGELLAKSPEEYAALVESETRNAWR